MKIYFLIHYETFLDPSKGVKKTTIGSFDDFMEAHQEANYFIREQNHFRDVAGEQASMFHSDNQVNLSSFRTLRLEEWEV